MCDMFNAHIKIRPLIHTHNKHRSTTIVKRTLIHIIKITNTQLLFCDSIIITLIISDVFQNKQTNNLQIKSIFTNRKELYIYLDNCTQQIAVSPKQKDDQFNN